VDVLEEFPPRIMNCCARF